MEIGKTIRNYEKERNRNFSKKGLEKIPEHDYNALKRESEEADRQPSGQIGERSSENETTIRTERGLPDPDATDGRTAGGNPDEVRTDEEEILTGEQERSLHGTALNRETERASSDHPETCRGEIGTSDRTDEGTVQKI